MRRLVLIMLLVLGTATVAVPVAWAGSPHFVGAATVTRSGDSLVISAKEAGLGDEAQISVTVTATAQCVNGGGNNPKAANKTTATTAATVPVQNGKADYTLTLTATFSPSCSPPMTIVYTNVTLTDTTNNLTQSFAGPL